MGAIYLRVTDDLKRLVEERARDEGESVNEYLTQLIEAALADDADTNMQLPIERTIAFLTDVAAGGAAAVVTYGDVAEHHGYKWSFLVWKTLIAHIGDLWRECRRRNIPALASLVVTKKSGRFPSSGFLRLERQGGAVINDPQAYVAAKQSECRRWATQKIHKPSPDPWAHLRGTWKGPDVDNFQDYIRGPADETAAAK